MTTPRFIYVLQFGDFLSGSHYATKEEADRFASEFSADSVRQFVEVLYTEASA